VFSGVGAEVRVIEPEPVEEGGVFAPFPLEVVGHGKMRLEVVQHDDDLPVEECVFKGSEEGVGPASLESLRQALLDWRETRSYAAEAPITVKLADVSEKKFRDREEIWPDDSPCLILDGEGLFVCVSGYCGDEKPDTAALRRLFEPFLGRDGASCHDVVPREHTSIEISPEPGRTTTWRVEVLIDHPLAGRTVAEAWNLGRQAQTLLRAAGRGELTQESALDLLRGGWWDLFLEQPESQWLDAKEAPYLPWDNVRKRELAKDVAAFANHPGGGVIVIGMKTNERKEGDPKIIKEVNQTNLTLVEDAETYRKAIRQWVYPEVEGFEVEPIHGATPGRGLLLLIVPPQRPESSPFLVNGVLLDGKLEGDYILLPFRRADETVAGGIEGIHARLRLGQQVLDGERPRPPGG
jgi:Putative DNA-binding domain